MRGPAADAALDTRRSAPYFFGMARSVDDILSELSWGRGYFPEEALRAALECGEAIVPHLVAAVERAAKEPDDVPDTYVLHVCALFLLAEMRERRAYRPIVDLCRLTDDRLDSLLGDVPTEGLPQILASVAQEDDMLLRELVEDEANSPAVRVAALHAMACCAVERVIDRDRFVGYLADLLRGNLLPKRRSVVLDEAACIAADLGLEPCLTESLRAFDAGLIRGMVISRQEIVEARDRAVAPFVPDGPERYGFVTSAVQELGRWRSVSEER